jgi:DNA-binding MarR family transcriptional regulator
MPRDLGRDTNPAFRLADFLPYRIVTVAEELFKRFAADYEESCGITVAEFRVMAVLAEHGVLSPTLVGHKTGMDKVKVSRASQSLVSRKLIRQNIDPRDGRGRLLRLTAKGQSLHQRSAAIARDLEAEVFGGFSRADRTAMNSLLNKIDAGNTSNGEANHEGFAPR